jgi:hypothetical protein
MIAPSMVGEWLKTDEGKAWVKAYATELVAAMPYIERQMKENEIFRESLKRQDAILEEWQQVKKARGWR